MPSVVDEGRLIDAVRRLQGGVWVDRLEATIEAHVMAAAQAREACGIPGTRVHTTYLCRDKPAMKEVLRAAGVPCARSAAPRSRPTTCATFAADVGYPIILKPAAGAGASGADARQQADELERRSPAAASTTGRQVAVEEFVEGHEGFFDTIAIDGEVATSSSRTTTPTCSKRCGRGGSRRSSSRPTASMRPATTRYARWPRVITRLGIGTSATHMEWFAGSKGLYFSEIGCRPPGVRAWDLYTVANDMDIYREWANAIVHGASAAHHRGGSPPG